VLGNGAIPGIQYGVSTCLKPKFPDGDYKNQGNTATEIKSFHSTLLLDCYAGWTTCWPPSMTGPVHIVAVALVLVVAPVVAPVVALVVARIVPAVA
jgi:hypothetical protein